MKHVKYDPSVMRATLIRYVDVQLYCLNLRCNILGAAVCGTFTSRACLFGALFENLYPVSIDLTGLRSVGSVQLPTFASCYFR